jgi:hypothetical protein
LKTVLEQNKSENKFILGSNMLLTKDIDAFSNHIDLKGKRITAEMKIAPVKTGTNLYFGLSTRILADWKTCPYPR